MNTPSSRWLPGLLLLVTVLLLPLGAGAQGPPADAPALEQPSPRAGAEDGAMEDDPAEDAAPENLAATGDEWVDAQLDDIGRYARRYPDAYADELQRYHDGPRSLVAALLAEDWAPGDVYFACALGAVTGRSCRFVADQRGQPPQVGWRTLAEQLGAGPGTPAFRRLKRGMVDSYARWGRPLELDAELAREFPDQE